MAGNYDIQWDSITIDVLRNRIQWKDILDEYDTREIIGYNLYYSEVPPTFVGDMEKLNDVPLTEALFNHKIGNYTKFQRAYYKVEVLFSDGSSEISPVKDLLDTDEYAINLLNRFMWGYMSGNPIATPIWIYSRKVSGVKCPECTAKGQGSHKDKCKTCYGTGFSGGGYFSPVLGWLRYGNGFNKGQSKQSTQVMQTAANGADTTAAFSIINPDDLIREIKPPQRLFIVTDVSMITEYNGRPIQQFLTLKQADSGHPLYDIPRPEVYVPHTYEIPYVEMDEDGNIVTIRDTYDRIVSTIKKNT